MIYLAPLEEEPCEEIMAIKVSKVELGGEYKYDSLVSSGYFECVLHHSYEAEN